MQAIQQSQTDIIYIATKNFDRFVSITRSLRLIVPNIKILSIDYSIPECKETGKDSKENAELKACHYYRFIKHNILTEDDSIHFNNLSQQLQPKHLIKKFITGTAGCPNWKVFFTKYNLKSGTLVKYFCFITQSGKVQGFKVTIPFVITEPIKIKKLTNHLNNFIIPEGFTTTFTQMNSIDKQKFSKKYIVPTLSKLFSIDT